jgi:hypothetical protein
MRAYDGNHLRRRLSRVLPVFPEPNVIRDALGLVEWFLVEKVVLVLEFYRALLEADVFLVRGFRRVPQVLTVRTHETPLPCVFVGEDGLGPVAPRAVNIRDPSDWRKCHSPDSRGSCLWRAVSN